jgi:lipopolysaccharide/colanic/teichoic acid biosynthesis glycosyltransferase
MLVSTCQSSILQPCGRAYFVDSPERQTPSVIRHDTVHARESHKATAGSDEASSGTMCLMKSTRRTLCPLKRLCDATVSLLGVVVFGPLLLVVAVVVLMKSGRPVFFLQERAGLLGKPFRIIKFRTMTRDAEQQTKEQWITAGNPYVTLVGRFLRRTSIDELPELVNVLKGDMSLVGPRPQVSEVAAEYSEFQRRRLEVRPGITGLAQVNGRNSISWTERIKLDVWYIDHWTPWLDVRILLMTIGEVLRQRGVEDMPPPNA